MSDRELEREEPTQEAKAPLQPQGAEVAVPRWVVLVTFVIGWGAGGTMLGFEIAGQGRFQVMVLAAWLITLPLVATNPLRTLRDLITGATTRDNGDR